jgi:D-threo-aldose 1-dehydrogenase
MDSDVIPRHGLGTAPIGGLFSEVADSDADETIGTALRCGVRYFDTAPLYGHGLAETRLGQALRNSTVARADLSISTKVGRVLVPGVDPDTSFRGVPEVRPQFDFSASGIRRSLDDSCRRLDVDHLELVLLHDPDDHESEALATGFPALVRLRDEGVIDSIGVGMNQVGMLSRFAAKADDLGLDHVLVAGRWTLLDRSAGTPGGLLDTCAANSVRVIVGGVFNSGVLATPHAGATFDYQAASQPLLQTAQTMAATCASFGVSLRAAAMQFPWRHPAVTSVIIGARSATEVEQNHADRSVTIPDDLWPALDECLEHARRTSP